MRLITIDNGNTNCTVGIFENQKLKEVVSFKDYQKQDDDFILISSVGKPLSIKSNYDLKKHRSSTHFFDMPVHYAMTLGDDRMIAAYGIYKQIKNNDLHLIIDAGTFITCDLVSKDGFLGGYIFPGIERFLATYANSENLVQYSIGDLKKESHKIQLPQTTEEAILEATKIYITESIAKIIRAASPNKVTLTGGNAIEVKELINLEVPFELSHHLVHLALGLLHQQNSLESEV